MSSASTIPPHFPLGTQPGQMHPSSQPVMDPARNDYAPRSYPWPSAIEPIAYSQAQAMLAATYANHAVASQTHGQPLPLAVQNDAAALEMAHQQYQSQLRAHANAYALTPATIIDDQLAAFYEQHPPVATIALHPYADANPYQFQPPNARAPSSITENILAPHATTSPLAQVQPTRATLHFSNLEAWMDVEYFNKVAGMMNWQNVILKVPHVPSNVGSSGKNGSLVPNNPGYCFMTFPTPATATAVLGALTEGDKPKLMPNSKRPFVVAWATVPASSARTNGQPADSLGHDGNASSLFAPGNLTLLNPHAVPAIDEPALQSSTRQQEFSIFVGDLAPETTNSDLIAVFRDPILGLRHDREPKYVAPFLSCKSAKIMVDPVMGVSKGYGFVRFGTMADASRALIEMQGLYCLSRPMRISQATAKARTHGFLPQGSAPAQTHGTPPQPFSPPFDYDVHSNGSDRGTGSTVTSPSVVHPVNNAAHAFMFGHRENTSPTGSNSSGRSLQEAQRTASHRGAVGSESDPLDSLPSDTLDALSSLNIDRNTLSQLLKMAMVKPTPDQEGGDHSRSASDPLSAPAAIRHFGQSDGMVYRASMAGSGQGHAPSQSYSQTMNATSARSVAPPRNVGPQSSPVDAAQASQAKALLASMIGNNASALNSSDPYNTTVFVGGLSGLISEDTLRTFFGPFGDIHYVKIPPGKGCGFVQFVRKADAEAAISKMQGFPIGGGRVRLSWGRSQYKAAQAAAQAVNFGGSTNETGNLQGVSETQATQILQALGVHNTGNAFPDQRLPSDFQTSRGFGQELPYGVESTGTLDQYDIRAAPGPHPAMQGESDLANVNLSRSHTFPMFTPFGGELNTFSPPNNVSASRSVAGMTVKPHAYGTGPTAPYGGSIALRGSISQRDFEGMENGYAVDSYSDRAHGSYPIRGSGTFQPNDLIRQERAGSGSTIATTASDKTPPPQPMKNDIYDLTGNFAALNFGQNSSFDVYPPHMAEANGMLSPTFGAYTSNKSPKRQYS